MGLNPGSITMWLWRGHLISVCPCVSSWKTETVIRPTAIIIEHTLQIKRWIKHPKFLLQHHPHGITYLVCLPLSQLSKSWYKFFYSWEAGFKTLPNLLRSNHNACIYTSIRYSKTKAEKQTCGLTLWSPAIACKRKYTRDFSDPELRE